MGLFNKLFSSVSVGIKIVFGPKIEIKPTFNVDPTDEVKDKAFDMLGFTKKEETREEPSDK